MNKSYTQKINELKTKISIEEELIEEYEQTIEELHEEIKSYEDDYDYESDPNGNDYDLNYVHQLNTQIEEYQSKIGSSERSIQYYEDEINTINFTNNVSIVTLVQKWETKLNGFLSFVDNVKRDWERGEYSDFGDYQNDLGKGMGMVNVTSQILEDLKEMIDSGGGTSFPKFSSIEEAYDYYWDLSRNPYDMYETERSLIEGEREFVENCGYDWNEWCDINKNINNN